MRAERAVIRAGIVTLGRPALSSGHGRRRRALSPIPVSGRDHLPRGMALLPRHPDADKGRHAHPALIDALPM